MGRFSSCEGHRQASSWTAVRRRIIGLLIPHFKRNSPTLLVGASRWSGRERVVIPVQPRYVVEVSADHIEGFRFRHGSRLLRWRDDKKPEQCAMEQIEGGHAGE